MPLLGFGVAELSVGPYAVPLVKQAVRAVEMEEWGAQAEQALALPSGAAVRELVYDA